MSKWYQIGRDMVARDLWTTVPLDWNEPDGTTIRVFAREIVDPATLRTGLDDVPAIVYLQGGPGGKGGRPIARDAFLDAALKRFRVVFPDQRGTGRSTPARSDDYAQRTAEESALMLSLMRADSIIHDMEAIRREHFGGKPWWSMGQSYGGFLTLHYLSHYPEALTACVITGGLPSIDPDPEAVYRATFPRVIEKNQRFFERFPHLRRRVDRIADILEREDIRLPDGDRLTVRRFQTLGGDFGMEVGFDRVHWILDEAFADEAETVLSQTFLKTVGDVTGYATNPLYMVLQESIYGPGPSAWAAERVRQDYPEFAESARPLLFTGEMAFPWMAEEIHALRGFKDGWNLLHELPWPMDLYREDVLARNNVPIEAAVYLEDMYVHAPFSFDTEARVGALRTLVTNELEHDGVRMGDVVETLIQRLELRLTLGASPE